MTVIYDWMAAAVDTATVPPDLVVLDPVVSDLRCIDLIATLRAQTAAPVIVLGPRVGTADPVAALDAGADDFLVEPVDLAELLARARAVARRRTASSASLVVRFGRFAADLTSRRVTDAVSGAVVRLTPTQWSVLEVLLRSPGRVVEQHKMLREVWGPEYTTETNYLRQYLAQLRRKFEDDPAQPRHLVTEPGVGYRLCP